MIYDVGKTPCVFRGENGLVYSFFNHTVASGGDIRFIGSDNKTRYNLPINDATDVGYRALHFTLSCPQYAMTLTPRPVIFTPPDLKTESGQGISSALLFQVIAPQIAVGGDGVQLTFWTNVTDNFSSENGAQYKTQNIFKVLTRKMGDIENTSSATKILCTCPIHFQLLQQQGGGINDSTWMQIPVIQHIAVVAVSNDGNYAFDFAGQGGSGNMRRHAHSSNTDGGFAFAVYAPSAILKSLSWT